MATRQEVFSVIGDERVYQDRKWGTVQQHPHEVGSWLTIMRQLLTDAEKAYMSQSGDHGALDELRKVISVGVACLEQYGPVPRKAIDFALQSNNFSVHRAEPNAAAKTETVTSIPILGEYCAQYGGIYAGIVRGEPGKPSYHLFHAAQEFEIGPCTWSAAVDRAKTSIAGFSDWSLPDRREARLLAINSPDTFDKDGWYWTSTQYADGSGYAWVQHFSDGFQDSSLKSDEYRARAVRRVLIIQ